MSFHRPDNQQVCWAVYWPSVMRDRNLAGLGYTAEDCARWEGLAMECFDQGEPIWATALRVKVAIDTLGTNEAAELLHDEREDASAVGASRGEGVR